MIVTLSKLLAIILALVVISKTYGDYRRGRESWQLFIFWSTLWLTLLIVVTYPTLIDQISLHLAKQRTSLGALFGLAFMFLLFLIYRTYAKAARVEYQLSRLIRELALKEFFEGQSKITRSRRLKVKRPQTSRRRPKTKIGEF